MSILNPTEENAVARVNETFCMKRILLMFYQKIILKTDSTIIVNDMINRWATKQLLVSGAELNLNEGHKMSSIN